MPIYNPRRYHRRSGPFGRSLRLSKFRSAARQVIRKFIRPRRAWVRRYFSAGPA